MGNGVFLHDKRKGYQEPITFRSGSRQVSMSVKEVSLYFLGGVPIQYFGLDPIDPRSSFSSNLNMHACMLEEGKSEIAL